MAALSSLLRRRPHLRRFSSAAAPSPPPSAPPLPLSTRGLKSRLRHEFDPDRAAALLASIPAASVSASTARSALSLAVRRLVRSRRPADAAALLSSHLASLPPSEPRLAAVLSAFGEASLPDEAVSAFRSAVPSLPSPPSALPLNALLAALLRSGAHRRVPDLFAQLCEEFSISPTAATYGILVKSFCHSRDYAKALDVVRQMREKGTAPTTTIYTTLIHSMYKQKKTEEAESLWKEMLDSGCKPDVTAYNVKAWYLGRTGKPEDVLAVIGDMEAAGVKPDTVTYNFLMTSYYKNGMLEDAMKVYGDLCKKKNGCWPNAITFKILLAALCNHGDFSAGLGVFKDSMKKNKVPDFKTMKGLVEGLVKEGRVVEAEEVVATVKNKFPANLSAAWRKLEKDLGLSSDGGDVPSQAEVVAEEAAVEVEDSSDNSLPQENLASKEVPPQPI